MKDKFNELTARWGGYTAPLIVAGATENQLANAEAYMSGQRNYMGVAVAKEMRSLLRKALSLTPANVSDVVAFASARVPGSEEQTKLVSLCRAVSEDWKVEAPTIAFIRTHKNWKTALTPLQIRTCISAKARVEWMQRVRIAAKNLELEGHSPSPTPARGAKNGQKRGNRGSGGVERVGALLVLLLMWLPTFAQTQPAPGHYQAGHAIAAGSVADTIWQKIRVSEWHHNCRDCDSFTIITDLQTGRKCVWKVAGGVTMNGTQRLEWDGSHWGYSVQAYNTYTVRLVWRKEE